MLTYSKRFTGTDLTRRGFLGGAGALALAAALPRPALALNTGEAKALIDKVVAEVNSIINSGQRESQMYVGFERVFTRYSDVNRVAQFCLGRDGMSKASSAQFNAYKKAFTGYVSRKYGKRFREFIGGKIIVKNAVPVKQFFEVRCTADLKGEAPFDISFLVSDASGRDLFFDLSIEGISLLKTEQAEIGAMLDKQRGRIDGLIAALKKAG